MLLAADAARRRRPRWLHRKRAGAAVRGRARRLSAKLWFHSSRRRRASQSANGPEKFSIAARNWRSRRETRASRFVALGGVDHGAEHAHLGAAAASSTAAPRASIQATPPPRATRKRASSSPVCRARRNSSSTPKRSSRDDQLEQVAQRERVARRAEQTRGLFGQLHFVGARRAIPARRPWRRRRRCGNASPRASLRLRPSARAVRSGASADRARPWPQAAPPPPAQSAAGAAARAQAALGAGAAAMTRRAADLRGAPAPPPRCAPSLSRISAPRRCRARAQDLLLRARARALQRRRRVERRARFATAISTRASASSSGSSAPGRAR